MHLSKIAQNFKQTAFGPFCPLLRYLRYIEEDQDTHNLSSLSQNFYDWNDENQFKNPTISKTKSFNKNSSFLWGLYFPWITSYRRFSYLFEKPCFSRKKNVDGLCFFALFSFWWLSIWPKKYDLILFYLFFWENRKSYKSEIFSFTKLVGESLVEASWDNNTEFAEGHHHSNHQALFAHLSIIITFLDSIKIVQVGFYFSSAFGRPSRNIRRILNK